jgi:lipid-A-disaccharide synthase
MMGSSQRQDMSPVIFISAGEASGEQYGAMLATSLQHSLCPKPERTEFFGMGGPRMQAAGVELVVRAEEMAVMGVTEILRHLPRIYRGFRNLKQAVRMRRPHVAVLIDFPDIHFRLAREFHRLGVPVIWFVSPQLWAWKQHRIELVRKYVRRMLVIFPFEEKFYRDRGIDAEFVGHPLADLPQPAVTREQFAAENGLDAARTWIGLLPGSRLPEIEKNLPEMLEAAWRLGAPNPPAQPNDAFEFLIPLAPTLDAKQRAAVLLLAEKHGGGLKVRLVEDARAALYHARASVVASGTATVEAALIGNPFVVVYRVSPLTNAVARRAVKVPHVAMANLIAGKRVVPELIQHEFTAANIVQQLKLLLPDGQARQSMMKELAAIRDALRIESTSSPAQNKDAIARVADLVIEEIGTTRPAAIQAAPL